ncbi:Tetraspanin-6 [Thelohanellus kitauei]|uniref:Tetraspanin-6 n=1 Tax=Thelohanellus kitauei TaxID=669202 RepID=A0A0C2NF55_THEKT|nr:Tetraspanin-6 [Thelohanellus kitauei]
MSARVITFFILFLFFLISAFETFTLTLLKVVGDYFCPEVVRYHVIDALLGVFCVLTILHVFAMLGVCFYWSWGKYFYTVVFTLLLILLTMVVSISYIRRDEVKPLLESCSLFDFNLIEYRENRYINEYQMNHHCCGLTGPQNWGSNWYPPSCCENQNQLCVEPFNKPCSNFLTVWQPWIPATILGGLGGMVFLSPFVIVGIIYSRRRQSFEYFTLN